MNTPYIFLCAHDACSEYAEKPIPNPKDAYLHIQETGHEVYQCLPDPALNRGNSGLKLVAVLDKSMVKPNGR